MVHTLIIQKDATFLYTKTDSNREKTRGLERAFILRTTSQIAFGVMKYEELVAGFDGFLPNTRQLPLVRQDNFDSFL